MEIKIWFINYLKWIKPQIYKDEVNKYIESINLNFELNTKEQKITILLKKIILLYNYNKESNEKMEKLKEENNDLKQKF